MRFTPRPRGLKLYSGMVKWLNVVVAHLHKHGTIWTCIDTKDMINCICKIQNKNNTIIVAWRWGAHFYCIQTTQYDIRNNKLLFEVKRLKHKIAVTCYYTIYHSNLFLHISWKLRDNVHLCAWLSSNSKICSKFFTKKLQF